MQEQFGRWNPLILAATLIVALQPNAFAVEIFDLIITDGMIIDGSGRPRFQADVGIKDGKISSIGDLDKSAAKQTINASGKIVSPGLIDMMGQTATPMIVNPRSAINLLSQGITTINAGEGVSAAPLGSNQERETGYTSMAEYFHRLDSIGLPVNVVQSVGHTQVRRLVLGDLDRRPSQDELQQMQQYVHEAMEAGAIGVSTALIYPPAIYAQTQEIVALAKVAGQFGGRYFTHMRNEGDQLLEAIDEALTVGQQANTSVHIFHLKAAGEQNWHKIPLAIEKIRRSNELGDQVTADIYPYLHNGLGILAFIHPRHFTEGREKLVAKLKDPELRRVIRAEMESSIGWENWFNHVSKDWNRIIVGSSNHPRYQEMDGLSLADMAADHDEDEWSTFFELAMTNAFVLPETMSSKNKKLLMQQPFISFCTDAGPAAKNRSASHPRAFGSFSRLLGKYVREQKVISLERAISQATHHAAQAVFAVDRGQIKQGFAADIIVFDETKIIDRADFRNSDEVSAGIEQVLVNGELVYVNGEYTGERPGRVLRGPAYREEVKPQNIHSGENIEEYSNNDAEMQNFLKQHRVPGAAVAVTHNGKMIYAKGFGNANIADREKVTSKSLFRIASLSKPITAVAVLKLAEEGKLTLNDRVYQRLGMEDEFEDSAVESRLASITIRQLLQHRGGWDRNQSFDPMFRSTRFAADLGVSPPADAHAVIKAMLNQPLDFNPGDRYAYSNFGYCLLGRVIEKVSGQTYEDYVKQSVLEPLGIRTMRLGRTRLDKRVENEVRYYHPFSSPSVFAEDLNDPVPSHYGGWHLEAMDSHGGWLASAEDLAKFAMAFDFPDSSPILSKQSITEMHMRPPGLAGHDKTGNPKTVYYSLGWSNRVLAENKMNHWHTGSLPGTTTILIRRHDGKNIVGLLNTRTSAAKESLSRALDQLMHRLANNAD